MRKKLLLITVTLSMLLLFYSGCSTFQKGSVTSIQNAAVVSVFCDKQIDMSDFKGMASSVSALAQNKDFKLKPIAVRMKDDVFLEYASFLPFPLMEEQAVINNDAYKNYYKGVKVAISPLVYAFPDGYQVIFTNKKNIEKMFEILPDADALIFVTASFKLDKVASILGFGTAKAEASHTITVIDRSKKIVMQKNNRAKSENNIKFALGGVFKASDIQPLCVEAINEATDMTRTWIQKEMARE